MKAIEKEMLKELGRRHVTNTLTKSMVIKLSKDSGVDCFALCSDYGITYELDTPI